MVAVRSLQRFLPTSILIGLSLLALPGWAQNTITANITGGSGSGKCTFEVRVDGVADVQIRNNQGYLQTRSGMQAQWVRLKCNQPLPRNPNNFRFEGVDGHGRQYLLKNPNANNGIAVIRIEDNQRGMEGYTGDIFWNGGNNSGGNWNGGWWNDDWGGSGGGDSQSPSGQWSVQSANYGSGNRRQDVTGNVRRLVNGPNFKVNNANMGGDPAVGADKTLQITARSQTGTVRTFSYREGTMVDSQMFSGGSGGGNWGGVNGGNNQWPPPGGNSQWSNNLIPNCQRAIRDKLVPQFGGTLTFTGTPSRKQAGSFVMVDGNANYRDGSGRQGRIAYRCTMHPNGNVADSSYNVTSGNFGPQPR